MKELNEIDKDDYEIIQKLINIQYLNEYVVSNYVIEHYNKNLLNDYTTYNFLENLKKSYLYYLELIDVMNEIKYIAFKLEKKEQNTLLFENLEILIRNVFNDKNDLTTIWKNLCRLSISSRSKSNLLDYSNIKVQRSNKDEKEKVILNKLEELYKFKKKSEINEYLFKTYNESSEIRLYDCLSNIYNCCIFYSQLKKSINNIGNILSDSGKEKKVKYYINEIIEKLNKDYESLTKIEDNLRNLYRIWQSKRRNKYIHKEKNTESNKDSVSLENRTKVRKKFTTIL